MSKKQDIRIVGAEEVEALKAEGYVLFATSGATLQHPSKFHMKKDIPAEETALTDATPTSRHRRGDKR